MPDRTDRQHATVTTMIDIAQGMAAQTQRIARRDVVEVGDVVLTEEEDAALADALRHIDQAAGDLHRLRGRTPSASDSVLFVGTYEIPPGGMHAFHRQVATMNEVVRDHEPRVVFIGHYVSADESEGTSIHLHPDAESFDFHMATATAAISAGTQIVKVKRIEFYGKPSDSVIAQLSGAFDVRVKTWADGLSRIEWP